VSRRLGPHHPVIGLRWPSLACVGLRWPALAVVGPRFPALALVGPRCPALPCQLPCPRHLLPPPSCGHCGAVVWHGGWWSCGGVVLRLLPYIVSCCRCRVARESSCGVLIVVSCCHRRVARESSSWQLSIVYKNLLVERNKEEKTYLRRLWPALVVVVWYRRHVS
jgi:hypothetical protein